MKIKKQIVETRGFSRQIDGLMRARNLLRSDYEAFKKELVENPEKGAVLSGTGGVRKVRLKSSSKGKRGGFRVCYFYYVENEVIYLLFIFQKSDQENLEPAEKRELKDLVEQLRRMR